MGIQRIDIAEHQRGLLFRNDNFVRVLGPGRYRFLQLAPWLRVRVDRYDVTNPVFQHALAEFLVKTHQELRDVLQVVELGDHEVGLELIDGKLTAILPPATRMIYWRVLHDVRVEVQDISADFAVPAERVSRIGQLRQANLAKLAPALEYAEVADGHVGLLGVNGRLVRVLGPGTHAFWKFNRTVSVEALDTRLQTLELRGQEILTMDKRGLRLDLTARYRVSDPEQACSALADIGGFLDQELQLGLRDAVGTRTLDELLAQKEPLRQAIESRVRGQVAAYGLELASIAVKDVVFPGRVANPIRRRQETAATRSPHDTAKRLEPS